MIIISNQTPVWSKLDQANFNQAQKRCAAIYPEAPCLKKFIKTETNVYRAICGEKTERRFL